MVSNTMQNIVSPRAGVRQGLFYDVPMANELTHVDEQGRARMVDVGGKPAVARRATAAGELVAQPATLDRVMGVPGAEALPKGEALAVARVAGVMAAKRCGELIPLCHPLPIEHASVDFERVEPTRLRVTATAAITAKTGVEMEALTAVSVALLTLYDMAKAVDKEMRLEGVRVVSKEKQEA